MKDYRQKKTLVLALVFMLALLSPASAKTYRGKPLSLNFQDIEVRAVLQIIGDFTDTNIVVSDGVKGNITLRLNDVPWDQALDTILQIKGLGMQENGNIIYVAPNTEIAAGKRAKYEVVNIEEALAPLQQQLIALQYARAEDLEKMIEDNSRNTRAGQGNKISTDGLLSGRGRISVDKRTNTLVINDIPSSIDKVRQLVTRLDVPVKQVLIDARIVVASNSFAHELGVSWGGALRVDSGSSTLGVSGSAVGASTVATGSSFAGAVPSLSNRLGVDLAATTPAGTLGLSLLGSDFLLDLELSAMQDEGRGEIISSPRVIAQDGGEATIKQGTKIAYTTTDNDGNSTTTWKDVPLMLHVKPKIAPNHRIDMALEIVKDTPGMVYNDEQGIDSSSVVTQVLVDDGETVVLGGVFEQTTTQTVSKVPVLGDLPVIGRAFRHDKKSIEKRELLIFVTPRIVNEQPK